MTLPGNASAVVELAFAPQCDSLLSGSEGGSLKMFDLHAGKISRALNGHLARPTALGYHPFGVS
jgi:katanin p80 WD40 repeat-containing subunit B1